MERAAENAASRTKMVPLGANYSPAQIKDIQKISNVPLASDPEDIGRGLIGKRFSDLISELEDSFSGDGGNTTIINQGGSGGDKSNPRGLERIIVNVASVLGWYFIAFLLCDFVYSDFDIVLTMLRIPRIFFGPIEYVWRDALGRAPLPQIVTDFFCQHFYTFMPSSLCGQCEDPYGDPSVMCEAACVLAGGALGLQQCLSDCEHAAGQGGPCTTSSVKVSKTMQQATTISNKDSF